MSFFKPYLFAFLMLFILTACQVEITPLPEGDSASLSGDDIGPTQPDTSNDNAAPVAIAGDDLSVKVDDTIRFDGSLSSDADGDLLTYAWSITSKPFDSNAELEDETSVAPTLSFDVEGDYLVRLIVSDGTVNSAPDTVLVSVSDITENAKPVARSGKDLSIKTGETARLDGSGSSDADGDELTFQWSFVSKPSGSVASLVSATTPTPSFIADVSGTYVVLLVVNDGTEDSILTGSSTIAITANNDNAPPVANAGSDLEIKTGEIAILRGSDSTDADGDALTYSWSLASKPAGSVATLSTMVSATTSFTADVDGTYAVDLIVNDGQLTSAVDTVLITATTANSKPVANAGSDLTITTGESIGLDGNGSSDADGDALTYMWSFQSKPAGSAASLINATEVTPSFIADQDGTYTINLVVNDGTENSSVDTVLVVAESASVNSRPVARSGVDQDVRTGDLVQLNGSGSSDADGDSLTFNWSITSKPSGSSASLANANSPMPSFTADRDGTYVVRLVVNDGQLNSLFNGGSEVVVRAESDNRAPVADAGANKTVQIGTAVSLDGSGSSDADGDSLTYAWSITSKPSGSSASLSGATSISPSLTPDLEGDYTIRLIVNDGTVASASDTVVVEATPEGSVGLPDGPSSDRHTPRVLGSTDAAQAYWEYLPPGYGDGELRPLLLFIHGLGENDGVNKGDEAALSKVVRQGIPKLINNDDWPTEGRPFVVLSPQKLGSSGCTSSNSIRDFLAFAMDNYDVDPKRIYLTGLSCGAIGSWNYLGDHTDDVVAASVLIAGNGNPAWNKQGCDLGKVAIWGFHGDADPTVNVSGTNGPINNLLNCPSPPRKEVKKTIYSGVKHDSWSRTYDLSAGHDPYAWLLTHEKP